MPENWYQIGQDIYGESESDRSGKSLSFSDDGKILAIGAHYGNEGGHVRIYKNNSGTWEQIGSDIDGEKKNDESGYSVSLSSDGSIVAIGAVKNDGSGKNSGHVRVYKNNSNVWEQIGSDIDAESRGDNFGVSVSLSSDGSIVAIGGNKNDENGSNSGHVRVYKNNSNVWEQIGSDIDGKNAGDLFGSSVSLSSDGSIIAIGGYRNDAKGSNSGHVRVYKNNSNVWEQVGSDIEGTKKGDEFGYSVSLSNDGSIVAIGAWLGDSGGANSGTVKVYENNSGSWEQIGADIYGEKKQDRSGGSVSLSNDGSIVAIGALHNDGNGADSGHVRIYKNNSGSWEQIGTDFDGDNAGDKFGQTISLSGDGSCLAIGALYNNGNGTESGQVKVFTTNRDDGNATFIINGIPAVGQNLSVIESNADPDGSGTLSYKWQSSLNGTTWSQISSNSTYLVTSTDQGKKIRALLSYTDGEGFSEEVSSSSVDIPSYKISTAFAKGEGETFQTEIETRNVDNGIRLYWGFSGDGITKNDFSEGTLNGSFIVKVNEKYSFSHTINNDLMTEGTEDLKLKIFSDKERKNQLGDTATLKIYDTSKQVTYTNTVNNQINVLVVQEYGKFINNLTFDRLGIAPTIKNKPETLEIGKTGINFSVELNNTSSKKISKTTTDLEPLVDGLTLTDKYLTYFSYKEASEGVAPEASTLTYDPTKKAGARFYDLDGDGSADTADLKLIDGGYGDKDGIVNGIIVDPSTAGTVDLKPQLFSRSQILIVLDPSDITSPASLTIRASLSSSADSVNQIGYIAFNSNEEENITYELIEERGSIIFSNLESTNTPDLSSINFQRDINLINGQKLVFFEVIDTTLESLLKNFKTIESFGERFRTLDIHDVSTSSAVIGKGGNSVSLSLIDSFSGLNEFISSEMDSNPILDFSGLASRNINGSVSISREAGYDSIIGFYQIQNNNGDVLDPLTGNLLSPGSEGYADAALDNINLFNEFGELSTVNNSTKTIDISSFSNAGILAPFANITNTGEKFFSFASANSDGLSHFRSLGSGVIGVEDLKGGGDQDFDDLILSFDFQLIS